MSLRLLTADFGLHLVDGGELAEVGAGLGELRSYKPHIIYIILFQFVDNPLAFLIAEHCHLVRNVH